MWLIQWFEQRWENNKYDCTLLAFKSSSTSNNIPDSFICYFRAQLIFCKKKKSGYCIIRDFKNFVLFENAKLEGGGVFSTVDSSFD